jgi:hypothetical protein
VWLMLVSPKRGYGTGGAPCGRVPLIVRLGYPNIADEGLVGPGTGSGC